MLSNAVERAQRKVEENNFGIRKRLLEYDDVMNSQREVIYSRRRNALYGERIDVDMKNMIADFAENFVEVYGNDYASFSYELMRQLTMAPIADEAAFRNLSKAELASRLEDEIKALIARRGEAIISQAMPLIKQIYETQSARYQNIAFPVIDGIKGINLIVNLKKAYDSQGKEINRAVAKSVTLTMIDEQWKEHLREMDDLKQSVQNATYEQKDPLLIYKFESFNLFKSVLEKISRDVIAFMVRAQLPVRQNGNEPIKEQAERRRTDMSRMRTGRSDLATNAGEPKSNAPVRVEKKVGRNDPCPCGSGKKYKNCHGKDL